MALDNKYSPLQIIKSLMFRTLTYRAAGFLGKPFMLFKVSRDALKKAGEDASLKGMADGFVENVKRLVRLIQSYAAGEYRGLDRSNMILVVAAILYFLSPIDIIPDFIPMIGLLDDITLITWVITTLDTELDKFEAYEADHGAASGTDGAYASMSYQELYEHAKERDLQGRSGMSKQELVDALSGAPA